MNFTTQSLGKKTKLLATTKRNLGSKNVLIDRLNNVLNNSGIPNLSTYFGIKEFNDTFDSKIFNGFNLCSPDHFIHHMQV